MTVSQLAAPSHSEARYQALFEAIDDGFCIIEFVDGPRGLLSDYVHVEANSGYERHTGIGDIVGKTIREMERDDADEWVELYGRVLETGDPIRFERHFVAAGRFIEVSARRIEPRSLRQVAILFRDVTQRKKVDADLRASEAVARENIQRVQLALAAGAIIGTWFWDVPGDRFTADEAFAAAFGLDPVKAREGLSLSEVVQTVHPDDRAGLKLAMQEALERGGAYSYQYRTRRSDGTYYWLEANGRVEVAADGSPLNFPGVLLDLTADRERQAQLEAAVSAQRELLVQKDALLQELNHRVKNSLQLVVSTLRLQARRLPDKRLAQDFDQAIRRVRAIVSVHERLYRTDNSLSVDMATHLEKLSREIIGPNSNAAVTFDLDPVELPVEVALPVSVLVSELLSQAYAGVPEGSTTLSFKRVDPNRIELKVKCDSPCGTSSGLTEVLVRAMAGQIGARSERIPGGQETKLTFAYPRVTN